MQTVIAPSLKLAHPLLQFLYIVLVRSALLRFLDLHGYLLLLFISFLLDIIILSLVLYGIVSP
jgi:hypothetical protein